MRLTRSFRLALLAAVSLGAVFTARAQTLDDLRKDPSATGAVLTYGMGYANQRYSSLDKINKRNVARL
ncbi:MAG TPA: PQQ-dependent dehydrogenase, methanol/ethanol family, partial [Caldimonas sp.]